jgi:flagellar assembly factor FliW
MMVIETRDFGQVEIDEGKIMNFPDGIPGFEEDHHFTLLAPLGDGVYPCWLQSADNPGTCFIVYNPFEVKPDYFLDEEQLLEELDVHEETPVAVFVLSIIGEKYTDTTVNLRCPVVCNLTTLIARQVILSPEYQVRARVFPEESGGA